MHRSAFKGCAVSLIAAGLVPADAWGACRYTDLSGSEAARLLSETLVEARNRSDKKSWREFHFRDGTTSFQYLGEDREYAGKWKVEGKTVCYSYGRNNDCLVVRRGSEECSVSYRLALPEGGKLVADVSSINWLGHNREGCFLTTAASRMRGRTDDCFQLRLLRWFRDEILNRDAAGRRDIEAYYDISPWIVRSVFERDQAVDVFAGFCGPVIDRACRSVLDRDFVRAHADYRLMVDELERSFL